MGAVILVKLCAALRLRPDLGLRICLQKSVSDLRHFAFLVGDRVAMTIGGQHQQSAFCPGPVRNSVRDLPLLASNRIGS